MEFWISESEKIERRKKWKQDFQSIGQDVYSFFIDTAIEKYMVNNSSSRKRYASPKAGTELYLDLVFRQ